MLGYDPTVKRCCDESGKPFYVFEIVQDEAKHYFYAIRVLSEYCAARISGHGTRVFVVWRCSSFNDTEPFGDEAVLKDFWLEEQAPPKWMIQAHIFSCLEELKKLMSYPEWLSSITNHEELLSLITTGDFKKYFMTILQYGEVWLGNACDHVPQQSIPLPIKTHSLALLSITNDPEASWVQAPPERAFFGRKHCQLVCKEVCQTFAEIMHLNVAVTTLLHGLTALQLLYLARYVHCDVSVRNILCYAEKQGKLSDLEYAKPFGLSDELRKDAKAVCHTTRFVP
ncbi:hypothetical protein FISHEDRAFT_73750 [Fistulina hepatica ATCC 64428]|uniref:Fungal-type protein kinase domain-containing protein n=1 Tax=Fistulina hepatica ATCC 64428 TaxID=1128425 RepID=A0A0D7AAZ4_9AGAR|nr:hypothetical protein FISHEDRAFT_73750 [Fistulina hepatica ATCC 64428]